ncbi:DinB family protein [Poriferisphaera corsica]|uniref:DinB family protein n=1 Tax=Poriferisphaera corsica TaxID=2528020 RepID=A0A517YQH3_9BACT|nr:DinB family protein [Poriferisphaera corsica]QDU32460.1 DinB family protein [Poriferisphaera corsica]
MNTIQFIKRTFEHRCWANHQLLEVAKTLTSSQLTQTFLIGQGSALATLVHLYAAELVWLEALHGNKTALLPTADGAPNSGAPGSTPLNDLNQLIIDWQTLQTRWQQYIANLTEDQLDTMYVRTNSRDGKDYDLPVADILIHVNTHANYTYAQLNNIYRQLDAPVPYVNMSNLSRQQHN